MTEVVLAAAPSLPLAGAPRRRAVMRSLSSMTGVSAGKALVSVLVSFLVARHVTPGDYGLVAFAVPLLAFITLLTDLGLASAIVREPRLDRADAGAAVMLMGTAGLAAGALLLACAFPLAHAVSMPGLGPVLALYAAVATLSIWAAAPRALLERRYDYATIATVEVAGVALGFGTFLLLAGRIGILSLVAYQLVLQLVRAVAFPGLANALFDPSFRFGRVRSMVRTGAWVLLTNILSFSARNLDNLLVGAWLGASALGLYGLGYQFMTVPLTLLTWPASGVLLSTLARLTHDEAARSDTVVSVVAGTAAASFPMMAFLAVAAGVPLDLLYSGRWHGLHELVAVLAPVGAIQAIAAYSGAVLVATGRIRLNFAIGLVNGIVLSAVFLVAVPFGLGVLVDAYAVVAVALSLLQIVVMCRAVSIGPARMAAAIAPGVLASVFGTAAFLLCGVCAPSGLGGWIAGALAFVLGAGSGLVVARRPLSRAGRTLVGLGDRLAIGTRP